jgi:UDP-glucuronate 4-epimerase
VRHSLTHPYDYVSANLAGHLDILEFCRHAGIRHLVYASSSSVYGTNPPPFSESDRVDHPLSFYAATKRSAELMSESYAHLFRLPQTGLRFFTVYGPWGRPDMTPWLFTEAILSGAPISLFNRGELARDFTFIDDVVDGVLSTLGTPPADDGKVKPGGSHGPHAIYNIGNNRSEPLLNLVQLIEKAAGRKAVRKLLPMQPGDVKETFADISAARRDFAYSPKVTLEVGVPKFVEWFRDWRGV